MFKKKVLKNITHSKVHTNQAKILRKIRIKTLKNLNSQKLTFSKYF